VVQLLDISRLEAGRLFLDRTRSDVVKIAESVVAATRVTTDRHQVTLEGAPSAVAWVDPLRIEQVIANMVDNAVKYSPMGGPVRVEVLKRGELVRISVRDQGVGVPEAHRARIFDRFHQAHPDHRFAGMGLGLHISREIVEMHGGRIEARFPSDGGVEMIVTLPVAEGEA
jgi:signal transduction histidine kinase